MGRARAPGAAAPAFAGPPYLTNDPAPTDLAHWEIYAFAEGDGRSPVLDGDGGVELNYGAAKDTQLSVALPANFSHAPHEGWLAGTGDLELGVKYRFFNDKSTGISAAIYPKVDLPTASRAHDEKTKFQFPLWLGKDFADGTSIFGGIGYLVNPGPGNRDFWRASVAVTRKLSRRLSVGAELQRQAADSAGGTARTRAGVGSILKLSEHYALLASGGPTWAAHRTGYHFYGALGLFF